MNSNEIYFLKQNFFHQQYITGNTGKSTSYRYLNTNRVNVNQNFHDCTSLFFFPNATHESKGMGKKRGASDSKPSPGFEEVAAEQPNPFSEKKAGECGLKCCLLGCAVFFFFFFLFSFLFLFLVFAAYLAYYVFFFFFLFFCL